MPGNVGAAAPVTVFPNLTYIALSKTSEWAMNVSQYPDGSSQRYTLPKGDPSPPPGPMPRARFRLRAKLGATAMAALRAFFVARKGKKEPFFLYWPWERTVPFSYDPTGTETDGRYIVRFDSDWNESWSLQRGEVAVDLVEIT